MKKVLLSIFILASSSFGANYIVDQKGKTFLPHELNLKVGDTITFTNSDPFSHNAYTEDKHHQFDIGMQKPGEESTITVAAKGNFDIECAIHPNMLLQVMVK